MEISSANQNRKPGIKLLPFTVLQNHKLVSSNNGVFLKGFIYFWNGDFLQEKSYCLQ